VRKENSEPIAAGGLNDPAKQFREFAAECVELAQTVYSPEKCNLYLEMEKIAEGSVNPEASVKSDGVFSIRRPFGDEWCDEVF